MDIKEWYELAINNRRQILEQMKILNFIIENNQNIVVPTEGQYQAMKEEVLGELKSDFSDLDLFRK